MPANGSAGSAFAASTVFNVAVTSGGRLFAFASSEVSTPPVMRSKAVLPVWFGATTTYPLDAMNSVKNVATQLNPPPPWE